jgi:hypothetical protein
MERLFLRAPLDYTKWSQCAEVMKEPYDNFYYMCLRSFEFVFPQFPSFVLFVGLSGVQVSHLSNFHEIVTDHRLTCHFF